MQSVSYTHLDVYKRQTTLRYRAQRQLKEYCLTTPLLVTRVLKKNDQFRESHLHPYHNFVGCFAIAHSQPKSTTLYVLKKQKKLKQNTSRKFYGSVSLYL